MEKQNKLIRTDIENLGLDENEAKYMQSGLSKLAGLNNPEEILPNYSKGQYKQSYFDAIADLKLVVESQKPYIQRQQRTRRQFLTISALGIAGLATSSISLLKGQEIGVMYQTYMQNLSQLKSQQEEQARIEAENNRLRIEQENNLGILPTSFSADNWRIRYPLLNPDIHYVEISPKIKSIDIPDNGKISLTSGETGMIISNYQKTDGFWVPKISIIKEYNYFLFLKQNEKTIEEWLLRNNPSSKDIDTRVVIFENKFRETVPIQILTNKTNKGIVFELRELQEVRLLPGM